MKKVYLASLFLAAISMTACDKDSVITDNKPNVEDPDSDSTPPDTDNAIEKYIRKVLTSEKWIWDHVVYPDGTMSAVFPKILHIRVYDTDGTGYFQTIEIKDNEITEEIPEGIKKKKFKYTLKNNIIITKSTDSNQVMIFTVKVSKDGNIKLYRQGGFDFFRIKKS